MSYTKSCKIIEMCGRLKFQKLIPEAGAPARGGQGGQAPTLEKNRVGPAHPINLFDRPFWVHFDGLTVLQLSNMY